VTACLIALLVMGLAAFRPVATSGCADRPVRHDDLARLPLRELDADLGLYGVPAEDLGAVLDTLASLDSADQRRRALEQMGLRALTTEEFSELLDVFASSGADYRVARPLTLADLRGPDGSITGRSILTAIEGIAADDEHVRILVPAMGTKSRSLR
jgi:hypothetical protein